MTKPWAQVLRGVRFTIGAVVAMAVLVLAYGVFVQSEQWCDGAFERWRISDDYRGGGCATITPAWHGIFPWNYGNDELVCLGMCPDDLLMWTPDG